MAVGPTQKNHEISRIEQILRRKFRDVKAYRYNPASIRVRVVDSSFEGQTRAEREARVAPMLSRLPESTRSDITVLLLLAPGELQSSVMNLEFENPTPSAL